MTDELDDALLSAEVAREVDGLDSRGIQLLMLKKIKIVAASQEKHDVALFGDEDLKLPGVVADAEANTQFREETITVMKVIRTILPPTTLGTAVLLVWKVWSLIQTS